MGYARTGAGILHFSPLDYFFIPHIILMDEFPVYTIRDDLNFAVGVCIKSRTRLQVKIIKCDQVPEGYILRIVVICKGEMEPANMPTVISEVNLSCQDFG